MKKKRLYLKPVTQVYELKRQPQLLTGSSRSVLDAEYEEEDWPEQQP